MVVVPSASRRGEPLNEQSYRNRPSTLNSERALSRYRNLAQLLKNIAVRCSEADRQLRKEGKSWREVGKALGIDQSGVRKRLANRK